MEDIEVKVNLYRLIDAAYGQVETALELQHEVKKLRLTQVKIRKAAIQGQLFAFLAVVIVAIPTIYGMLPDDTKKTLWLISSLIAACLYLLFCLMQWCEQREERAELDELTPIDATGPVENQIRFILVRISSYGTRLSAAKSILESNPSPLVKRKFENVKQYYESALDELEVSVDQLHGRVIDNDAYAEAVKWLKAARDGQEGDQNV